MRFIFISDYLKTELKFEIVLFLKWKQGKLGRFSSLCFKSVTALASALLIVSNLC